jgi:hypothetical protein
MTRQLRRRIRALQAAALANVAALALVSVAAFRQPAGPQRYSEITVERMNVVDANGTLRLVISNKDRMHPGVIDGKTINRARPVAGLLFFNDEGDEVGGLVVSGQEKDGLRNASALLAFDQLKQDQTIGLSYSEADGQRNAGLQVWDRSDTRLSVLVDQLNAANAIADPTAREAAVKSVRANAPPGPRRLFAGKNADRSAAVSLADGDGKPRLVLKVEADGRASISFLDATGKVVDSLPK